jgi:cytochrome c553
MMKPSEYAILLAAGLFACASVHAADVAAGKAKAEEVCADCHGDDGTGDDESPDIATLTEKEFVTAMQEFQSGKRNDPGKMAQKMVRAAKRLSAEDVANLAAYYQTLK